MHAALKQQTENIYHFWHPSHRTEVKYSQPYTPTKTDRSETRDPCSLKGRSSRHVTLCCTKVALGNPSPFLLCSACVDSACPNLNPVPNGRFHTSYAVTHCLGAIPFPGVFHPEGTARGIGIDCVAAVIVISAIYNVPRCPLLMGVG